MTAPLTEEALATVIHEETCPRHAGSVVMHSSELRGYEPCVKLARAILAAPLTAEALVKRAYEWLTEHVAEGESAEGWRRAAASLVEYLFGSAAPTSEPFAGCGSGCARGYHVGEPVTEGWDAPTSEQDRLAAIGEAVERWFDGHDAKIEYLAPDPADDFDGGWMASRSRGKYPGHPNASRPWLVGEGSTLPAAVDAALADRGQEKPDISTLPCSCVVDENQLLVSCEEHTPR